MEKKGKWTTGRLVLAVIVAPIFAVYGIVVLLRWVRSLSRRARGVGAALGGSIRCANGHRNATVGRFSCSACGSTYHGWIGRCSTCGAGAGWTTCQRCGVSIVLPWERR